MFEDMTEEQRKAFTDIAILMYKETEEAMNAVFNTTGWSYRDINWMPVSYFDELFGILGHDNYKVIATTVRDDWAGGPFCRGQFLFSPEGQENIKEWNKTRVDV